jgi:membrane associated rhomboid family serine protease
MLITLILVAVTVLVSMAAFNNEALFMQLRHYPGSVKRNGEWYRLITHGFVHADYVHLALNMLVLYQFGGMVEAKYVSFWGATVGHALYLALYLLSLVAASLYSQFKNQDNPNYSAVGASGAVSGIVFNTILFHPWMKIYVYFIPLPGIVAGLLYLAYSSWASKNSNDNVGHDAHYYGAIFGFLFTLALKPMLGAYFWAQLVDGIPLLK